MKMNYSNALRNAAIGAASLAISGLSMAQSDPFSTAVTDVTTKVTTYGGAMIGVAAVGVVLMIGVKYVKKLRGAA